MSTALHLPDCPLTDDPVELGLPEPRCGRCPDAGCTCTEGSPAVSRQLLQRRARRLEYVTIGCNTVEAATAIGAGIAAGSLGLVAFGTGSCVEVFASTVVLWHLRSSSGERSLRALRLLAVAFIALALFLLGQAAYTLLHPSVPDTSPLGLAMVAASVTTMFALAFFKRRLGRQLDDQPLLANASMTFLDGCVGVSVLAAVTVSAVTGWAWLDPAAALLICLFVLREARHTWHGEH